MQVIVVVKLHHLVVPFSRTNVSSTKLTSLQWEFPWFQVGTKKQIGSSGLSSQQKIGRSHTWKSREGKERPVQLWKWREGLQQLLYFALPNGFLTEISHLGLSILVAPMTIQMLEQIEKVLLQPILNSFLTILGFLQIWSPGLWQLKSVHVKIETIIKDAT